MKCKKCNLGIHDEICGCSLNWKLSEYTKQQIRYYVWRYDVFDSTFTLAKDMLHRAKIYPKSVRFIIARFAIGIHENAQIYSHMEALEWHTH